MGIASRNDSEEDEAHRREEKGRILFPAPTFARRGEKDIGSQRVISCIKHNPIDHKNIWLGPKKGEIYLGKGGEESMANFY